MRFPVFSFFCAAFLVASPTLRAAAPSLAAKVPLPEPVWQATLAAFDEASYAKQVELLIANYEKVYGKKLVPGLKKKAGLKVYADSGPGMATPVPLVKAVIDALVRRGFDNKDIFLVGLNALRLRMTGYLPSLVSGATPFNGNPVYVLESGRYYDPVWFYDSPLPQRFDPIFAEKQTEGVAN
ncbi:MAG: hypothetical protein RLZZ162_208, partial [Verrucomicrobiota bacterium]